jgi:hypothetical protein
MILLGRSGERPPTQRTAKGSGKAPSRASGLVGLVGPGATRLGASDSPQSPSGCVLSGGRWSSCLPHGPLKCVIGYLLWGEADGPVAVSWVPKRGEEGSDLRDRGDPDALGRYGVYGHPGGTVAVVEQDHAAEWAKLCKGG